MLRRLNSDRCDKDLTNDFAFPLCDERKLIGRVGTKYIDQNGLAIVAKLGIGKSRKVSPRMAS